MFQRIRDAVLNNSRGFTLIELLAVMAIVGVLAGIVTSSVSGTTDESRDAQVANDSDTVFNAANQFFTDQGGVGIISRFDHDVLGLKAVTSDNVTQEITKLWPERAFGVGVAGTLAYPAVFPATDDVSDGVRSVVFFAKDGKTPFQIIDPLTGTGKDVTLAVFLAEFTALDFNTLVVNGYMDSEPNSFESLISDKYNLYLWTFKKSTTPGGITGDTRDVAVFRLQSAAGTAGLVDLVYRRVQ
ncbi:MAG: prepilin-type N-terminal cleavage/methylation domain-containing protein [Chloroflexi bacterium]|nr:prepilin-type N-terminal cleavage/methylation domain-containing protein [Chloroflexota bacterium]PKB58606.1 MAG: hypothetical protein BZY83_06000 [SAR202 cluster bacterium Casp-Chloro-G2]